MDNLLKRYQEFKNEGAYPFNIIWALAQIGGENSLNILNKYIGKTNHDRELRLADKAIRLREEKGDSYGLLLLEQKEVFSFPSEVAPVIKTYYYGDEINLSLRVINNLQEEGLSGPHKYDEVILDDNKLGYILRNEDNFPVFM